MKKFIFAFITIFLFFYSINASADICPIAIDESNVPDVLPNGQTYATVTLKSCQCQGNKTGVQIEVDANQSILIPGSNFGIQKFGFNYNGTSTLNFSSLPNGWSSTTGQQMDGQGRFDYVVSGNGFNRQDPLSFTICSADNLNLSDFTAKKTNKGYYFSAHIAGFVLQNSIITSAYFGTRNNTSATTTTTSIRPTTSTTSSTTTSIKPTTSTTSSSSTSSTTSSIKPTTTTTTCPKTTTTTSIRPTTTTTTCPKTTTTTCLKTMTTTVPSKTTTTVSPTTTTTVPPTTTTVIVTTVPTTVITTIITTTTTEPPTAIELQDFKCVPGDKEVLLIWVTAGEIDNEGFNIYRSETEDGDYVQINETLIPAEGSPTQGAHYKFVDKEVQNRKTYYYKLEDIDINGDSTFSDPISATPRFIYGIAK